jgi:chromosome segregation ATPase
MPEEVSVEHDSVSDEVISPNSVATQNTPVEPKVFDEAYVKSVREEAARHRTEKQQAKAELEELKARLQEIEDAKMSAEDKLARDFEEARTKAGSYENIAREAMLKYELALAAREENIQDVKAAVKLADRELIEYDAAGNITNLPDVIQALKSEYSSLFSKAASAPHTGVTNPAKAPSAKQWTREDLKNLSPERRVELMASGELNHLLKRK